LHTEYMYDRDDGGTSLAKFN